MNLLANAAKYTPSNGRISLDLGLSVGQVRLSVRDNGIGITPDMVDRIFEPFMQVRDSALAVGGLGIGLTLVRKLVELHGGEVSVSSAGPGKGSEFVVRLPAAAISADGIDVRDSGYPRVRPGLRVLIVDDNTDALRSMEILLGQLGCDIEAAKDGASALAAAAAYRPEVVLLDIGLPDIDGREVAQRLRRDDSCADALLIAISGFGSQDIQRTAAAAGFDHYLVKPVDYRELLNLIASRGLPAAASA